jgi:hypothetical protein
MLPCIIFEQYYKTFTAIDLCPFALPVFMGKTAENTEK